MQRRTLILKTIRHYRGTSLAIALGVATAAAVMTGALIVGDSMRGSLRDLALARLGSVHTTVHANRFFSDALPPDESKAVSVPLIQIAGSAVHADTRRRTNGVAVYGVDRRFWMRSARSTAEPPPLGPEGVAISARLAEELGAQVGDDILVRFDRHPTIPVEMLLGRRDEATATLRRRVVTVLPHDGPGGFSLRPGHAAPLNAFIALPSLQKALNQPARVNTILFTSDHPQARDAQEVDALRSALAKRLTLNDLGLTLRMDQRLGYVALESESLLIPPSLERAATAAGADLNAPAQSIITYLANEITVDAATSANNRTAIPYSTVSAIEPALSSRFSWHGAPPPGSAAPAPGEIILADWAAKDLGAKPGDPIALRFYHTDDLGQLETRTASFRLAGVFSLSGAAADPGFAPTYPGITNTRRITDWNPPFPVDLRRIRDKDERYWERHHATPKAFISLADGLRLWTEDAPRFGSRTSLRFYPIDPSSLPRFAEQLTRNILERVTLNDAGLVVTPVRAQALGAGAGSTDFGGLFLGFSFFIIAAAALLVALLNRLGIARRSQQIGLLAALGFEPKAIRRMLLTEGLLITLGAAAIGQIAAVGFAALMLTGLKSRWADAVNAPFLTLHVDATTIAIGFSACLAVSLGSIAHSLRMLGLMPPIRLLQGAALASPPRKRHKATRRLTYLSIASLAAAGSVIVLSAQGGILPPTAAYFASGGLALLACIGMVTAAFYRSSHRPILNPGLSALCRLGLRNATRHGDRSSMTATLLATSTFLLASIQAFYVDPDMGAHDKHSPSGGYELVAESSVPLPYRLDQPSAFEPLNLSKTTRSALAHAVVTSFRLAEGDATGCTNLYRPVQPRIIGADRAAIEHGGFPFAATLANTPEEQSNPWRLLNRRFDDGAIAAIGDQNAVLWQLHSGLGQDFPVRDEHGRTRILRFVALFAGSALQDELIVSNADFKRLFPGTNGHGFFLIDAPAEDVPLIESGLERDLEAFGLNTGRVRRRLADYNAVQNTYLGAFQTLGGLGLVLGSLGLVAIMLRNVWERRRELALMQALGFSRRALATMVLAENAVVAGAGILAGLAPALIAVIPQVMRRGLDFPVESVAATVAGVLALGLGAGAAALIPALRIRLIPALRNQ